MRAARCAAKLVLRRREESGDVGFDNMEAPPAVVRAVLTGGVCCCRRVILASWWRSGFIVTCFVKDRIGAGLY